MICGVFLCSFTTLIGASVGIARPSIILVFLASNGIVKILLKTIGRKRKHRKTVFLARSKLNIIKKIRSKALADAGISYEKLIVNFEEQNYFKLRGRVRINVSQRVDLERDSSIEHGKRIGIDKILKQNERQNLKLKIEV